jgi:flagellar biosynthesis/type III secretory pathway protein FliH
MTNNKQQTAVEWFSVRRDVLEIEVRLGKLSPIEYAEELTKAEQQAKEMEKQQKQISYADGYAEGYKRALEIVEWYIKNYISGMPQDHIVDTNKKV